MVSHPHSLLAWELGWGRPRCVKEPIIERQVEEEAQSRCSILERPVPDDCDPHGLYITPSVQPQSPSQQPAGSWLTGVTGPLGHWATGCPPLGG